VLVKDGKPCSGGSNSSQQQSQNQQSQQVSGSNTSLSSSGNNNVVLSNDNTHSPDTAASTLLSTYNSAGHNVTGQMLQQPCNNSLMSNSLAMAYRNQNNFMANGHQQQCGTYLPLQTRAW
jgi:homeobox protein Nkx-2.1